MDKIDKQYKLTKESFEKNTVVESLEKYPKKSHQYFLYYLSYEKNHFDGKRPYLFFNNVSEWKDPKDRKKFEDDGKKILCKMSNISTK